MGQGFPYFFFNKWERKKGVHLCYLREGGVGRAVLLNEKRKTEDAPSFRGEKEGRRRATFSPLLKGGEEGRVDPPYLEGKGEGKEGLEVRRKGKDTLFLSLL